MTKNGKYLFSGQNWSGKRLRSHLATRVGQLTGALINEDAERVEEVGPEVAAACQEFVQAAKREGQTGAAGRSARPAAAGRT